MSIHVLCGMSYRAQHLIISNRPRDIALDIQITNEEIFITGTLYYLGFQIIIGITIENGRIGINGHTHRSILYT
jgi:hypothetical protein